MSLYRLLKFLAFHSWILALNMSIPSLRSRKLRTGHTWILMTNSERSRSKKARFLLLLTSLYAFYSSKEDLSLLFLLPFKFEMFGYKMILVDKALGFFLNIVDIYWALVLLEGVFWVFNLVDLKGDNGYKTLDEMFCELWRSVLCSFKLDTCFNFKEGRGVKGTLSIYWIDLEDVKVVRVVKVGSCFLPTKKVRTYDNLGLFLKFWSNIRFSRS